MSFRKFYLVVVFLVGLSPVNLIAGKAFGIVILTNCGVISEEYETRVNEMIEKWGARNPELEQPLKDYIAANRSSGELLQQYNSLSLEQIEQLKAEQ